jgi:hypothetical protein
LPQIVLHLKRQPVVGALSERLPQSLRQIRRYAGAFSQKSKKRRRLDSEVASQASRCHLQVGQDIDAQNLARVRRGGVGHFRRAEHEVRVNSDGI